MTNYLTEGRGIAARDTIADNGAGAIFTNDKGESIELHSVIYFPEEGKYELHGWKDANINLLFDDQSVDSPETGSLNLRGLLCRVYPAF